jgi:predicted phage terminase large subunit-like protein
VNVRLAAIEYYQSTLVSRLDSKEEGVKIVVGQRTALDDLPGFLIDQGAWQHLNVPAIAWKNEIIPIGPGLTFSRCKGDVLHPERESTAVLEKVRLEIGSKNFDAQYLQRPGAPAGAIINPNWFPRYKTPRPLHEYESRVLILDAAASDSDTSSYTACSVFGVRGNATDLLHVCRKRMLFDDLQAQAEHLVHEYRATHLFIETEPVGKSLAQVLRRKFKQGIYGCYPQGRSKQERLELAMAYLQQKRIRIPLAAPWLSTWEGEVFSFPSVAHADQVDTLAYFALYAGNGLARYNPLSTEERPGYYLLGGPRRLVSWA